VSQRKGERERNERRNHGRIYPQLEGIQAPLVDTFFAPEAKHVSRASNSGSHLYEARCIEAESRLLTYLLLDERHVGKVVLTADGPHYRISFHFRTPPRPTPGITPVKIAFPCFVWRACCFSRSRHVTEIPALSPINPRNARNFAGGGVGGRGGGRRRGREEDRSAQRGGCSRTLPYLRIAPEPRSLGVL